MADSDNDDYDRSRRRDKFTRERRDYNDTNRRQRDDWQDPHRGWNDRPNRQARDAYGRDYRRDRYSPDMSPPNKRIRGSSTRDWPGEDSSPRGSEWDARSTDSCPTQPPMDSFKKFLSRLDDEVRETDAVKMYNEYKLEFRKNQIKEFFEKHKDEEWLRVKYHPEEKPKRDAEQQTAVNKRLEVFNKLMETGLIDSTSVDVENSDKITHILNAAVIYLEGGTDFDLQVLDQKEEEEPKKEKVEMSLFAVESDKPNQVAQTADAPTTTAPSSTSTAGVGESSSSVTESSDANATTSTTPSKDETSNAATMDTNSQTGNNEANSDAGSQDEIMYEGDKATDDSQSGEKQLSNNDNQPNNVNSGEDATVAHDENDANNGENNKQTSSDSASDSVNVDAADNNAETAAVEAAANAESNTGECNSDEPVATSNGDNGTEAAGDNDTESTNNAATATTKNDNKPDEDMETEPVVTTPRSLHRTASIFLRNLPPNVTKAEVLEVCRKFNGFLRLSIADPQPDRKFYRRGWATFNKDVQIKDICWQFNKHKFGGIECGAIINRELSRRIRSVNGIASHRSVVRADIRHAAKIVYNLDREKGLWQPRPEDAADGKNEMEKPQFSDSRNQLLHNITDFLIEEADAEEEELLGSESDSNAAEVGQSLERDEQLLGVLDRMLLYLRVVHSLDFYNHTDYPQEDEMPNRIGIMHARGSPPSSKVTLKEVNEYIKNFEEKIKPFLDPSVPLTEEEAKQLGLMSQDEAVEKFVKENTKCTKPGKYECAIENKKFKGPEFVSKHIHNKHQNLIEEVKKDCICFNNYIMDAKRPSLPEHPSNRPQQSTSSSNASTRDPMNQMSPHTAPSWAAGNAAALPYPHPYPPPYGQYGPPRGPHPYMPMHPWPARPGYPPMPPAGYGMSMPPSRVLKSYRDLDAPNDW